MKLAFTQSMWLAVILCSIQPVAAVVPAHTISHHTVHLHRVGLDNPILYDNDWWTDVPDAAYLWAKASLGEARLVGKVVTRCTFGWEKNSSARQRR